jgi:hypothetical protein
MLSEKSQAIRGAVRREEKRGVESRAEKSE